MGIIDSIYLNYYRMLKETERIKNEVRRQVKEGKCKEEYYIPLKFNRKSLSGNGVKGLDEFDREQLEEFDRELLNKMINVSMDDFAFLKVSNDELKLITYDFRYAEVQDDLVYLKFDKVL